MTPIKAQPAGRSAMSLYAKPSHKATARMVGYALTLDDADGYLALSCVLELRLTDKECASLAFALLRALDQGAACAVADAALGA